MLKRFEDARVFVIDDTEANIVLLDRILRRSGLREIQTFTSPVEALARLEDAEPDLILLDLHMPQMDGFEVLKRLGERSDGSYLPVLVLTADSLPETTLRALNAGARDFITKPFDVAEVVLRVRNLLELRYLYSAMRRNNENLSEELGKHLANDRNNEEQHQLERDLIERVIHNSEINMVFQPIVEMVSSEVVGYEALSRFPGNNSRAPDQWFLKAAEVGLGVALELAAVRGALSALDVLPISAFLAVNISPAGLLHPTLTELCTTSNPERLVIELTEHVPIENYDLINSAIKALRESGMRISVDDTGAGYASFRHLLNLNPDIVKLDISLVRGIDHDVTRRALGTALIQFTSETGAQLIAEGIETMGEFETLKGLNAPWGQGYYLGRPQDASSINR